MKQLLFLTMVALSLRLAASPVDSLEARNIAEHYFLFLHPDKSSVNIERMHSTYYLGLLTRYTFVFENHDFVMVSANDATVPVFAYSRERSYQEEISPDCAWWLEDEYDRLVYEKHITNADNKATRPLWDSILTSSFSAHKEMESVGPLIKSRWGQSRTNDMACPGYNAQVPGISVNCGCGRCTAGCVAVAMAQIMNYWQFPATGINGDFDWCNMPNQLIMNNGAFVRPTFVTECLAISGLLADCGATADLEYCIHGCATGSTLGKARNALAQNYGYSPDIQRRYRWLTSNWKAKLHENIDLGLPILYGGQSETAGHAFVCDGYEGSDYFHFNWGWNGAYDGYFYLSEQEGNPTLYYDGFQEAIFNIHPEIENDPNCYYCNDSISLSNSVVESNPFNPLFPYILWSGLSSLYNYNPLIFPSVPINSDIVTVSGESCIQYDDIYSGKVKANGVLIPDHVIVHIKAYHEIELQNFETTAGADFTAEIVDCERDIALPTLSGLKIQSSVPIISYTADSAGMGLYLWPNPASNKVNVGFYSDAFEMINITLRDVYGTIVRGITVSSTGIGSQTAEFMLEGLTAGLYYIEVQYGHRVMVEKLGLVD